MSPPPRLTRRAFLRGTFHPLPAAAEAARVVALDPSACLGSALQVCTSCVERCGARGALHMAGLVPAVLVERCTGCGACTEACPAPLPALRLVARGP